MTVNEVFEIVKKNICLVIPELSTHNFKQDDRLVDLGANSVDRAEIGMLSMEALSLNIPRVELFGIKNIGELAKTLFTKHQAIQKG